MGGWGSSRWDFHQKKEVVENCLVLDAYELASNGKSEADAKRGYREGDSGYIALPRIGLIQWEVIPFEDPLWQSGLMLVLRYAIGTEIIRWPIPLDTTALYWGGKRWWFICARKNCLRRVGKLYLPPRRGSWGCRHCHKLSYRSRQTWDKRFAHFQKGMEFWRRVIQQRDGMMS